MRKFVIRRSFFYKLEQEYGPAFEPYNADYDGYVEIYTKLLRETPKAFQVEWGFFKVWIPKSLVGG